MTAVGLAAGALSYGVEAYKPVAAAPQDGAKTDDKPKADGAKTDKELLQGAWKVAGVKSVGPRPPAAERMVFYFAKEKIYLGSAEEIEVDGNVTIDPAASPKQITLTMGLEKRASEGIYELDGNKLKIALTEKPGGERPKDFDGGSGTIAFMLERDAKIKMPDLTKMGNKLKMAAARQVSANNIGQLLLAMHNYHDVYSHFPPAAISDKDGKPLLSWRVAILPYIEQDALYKAFKLDEPWDSDHNKKLLAKMPKIYGENGTKTHYRVFTGKGTIFEGTKGIKVADITDGMSNTAMIFEAADAVEWTEPEEFVYDTMKSLPKLGGVPFENGFHIGMADGSVRFVSTKIKEATLRALITRNGGEVIDLNKEEE